MPKIQINKLLQDAVAIVLQAYNYPHDDLQVMLEFTKTIAHGDFTSNIPLILAPKLAVNPRALANDIIAACAASPLVSKMEVAGPGFINIFLQQAVWHQLIYNIIAAGPAAELADNGNGQSVMFEFVSSNPTGPLHVGHGRHAAYGDVLANLWQALGYKVWREYYINDGGRQIDVLVLSVWLRYLELCAIDIVLPEECYHGDYVVTIAQQVKTQYDRDLLFDDLLALLHKQDDPKLIDVLSGHLQTNYKVPYEQIKQYALDYIIADIREDLTEFGLHYDCWFAESSLSAADINNVVTQLQVNDYVYEHDGATWFSSTTFGDDKDRVLIRANGRPTYFAYDIAYHLHKFARQFTKVINITGADHHGYIQRMQAAMSACQIAPERLVIMQLQHVSLYRGAIKVPMSTRQGEFVTLRELRQEVGNDAARLWYLSCKSQQHIDFDLELAKSQSSDNPIYYIQYAYTRIASVFRAAHKQQTLYSISVAMPHLHLLTAEGELGLFRLLARYVEVVKLSAETYEPYHLVAYLRNLATAFHAYYNSTRFISADHNLTVARLMLLDAIRTVIQHALVLLNIVPVEYM